MPDSRDIHQSATELVDLSREYLRQEVVAPGRHLGKQAGLGIGGAVLVAIGAVLGAWALYYALIIWLPGGEWYVVLSRFITAAVSAGVAGLVVWRMQRGGH